MFETGRKSGPRERAMLDWEEATPGWRKAPPMSKVKATIENLAMKLAAAKGGRIAPNDLLPYLPISLRMAERHLEEMADGAVVIASDGAEIQIFEFPEFFEAEARPLVATTCLACPQDIPDAGRPGLCRGCERAFEEELYEAAERTAWPAEAIKEHEILFITSSAKGPISVASVAGRSRLTLARLKDELKALAGRKFARAVIDEANGILSYEFPPIDYDPVSFKRNYGLIRHHPSSLKEELEVKLVKALTAVGVILVGCFALGVFRVPFPLVLLGGVIASAAAVAKIFLHKRTVTPEQI